MKDTRNSQSILSPTTPYLYISGAWFFTRLYVVFIAITKRWLGWDI